MAIFKKCKPNIDDPSKNVEYKDGDITVKDGIFNSTDPVVNEILDLKNKEGESLGDETVIENEVKAEKSSINYLMKNLNKLYKKGTHKLSVKKKFPLLHNSIKNLENETNKAKQQAMNSALMIYSPLKGNASLLKTSQEYLHSNMIAQLYTKMNTEGSNVKGLYGYNDFLNGRESTQELFDAYGKAHQKIADSTLAILEADEKGSAFLHERRKQFALVNNQLMAATKQYLGKDISGNFESIQDYMMAVIQEEGRIQSGAESSSKVNKLLNWQERQGSNKSVAKDMITLDTLAIQKQYQSIARMKTNNDIIEIYDKTNLVNTQMKENLYDIVEKSLKGDWKQFSNEVQAHTDLIVNKILNDPTVSAKNKDLLRSKDNMMINGVEKTFGERIEMVKNETVLNQAVQFRNVVDSAEFTTFKNQNERFENAYKYLENGEITGTMDSTMQDILSMFNAYDDGLHRPGTDFIQEVKSTLADYASIEKAILSDYLSKNEFDIKKWIPEDYAIVDNNLNKMYNKDGTPLTAQQQEKFIGNLSDISSYTDLNGTLEKVYDAYKLGQDSNYVSVMTIQNPSSFAVLPQEVADAIFDSRQSYMTKAQANRINTKISRFWRKNILISAPRVLPWGVGNKLGELSTLSTVLPTAITKYGGAFATTRRLQRLNNDVTLLYDAERQIEFFRKQAESRGKPWSPEKLARETAKINKFVEKNAKWKEVDELHYTRQAGEGQFTINDLQKNFDNKELRKMKKIVTKLEGLSEVEAKSLLEKGVNTGNAIWQGIKDLWDTQGRFGKDAFNFLEWSPRLALSRQIYLSMQKSIDKGVLFDNFGSANRHNIRALLAEGKVAEAAVQWANENYIDYSNTPNWVKRINAQYIPFFNFTVMSANHFMAKQANYLQNIHEKAFIEKSVTKTGKEMARAGAGWALMGGGFNAIWNGVLQAMGIYDPETNPPPEYLEKIWSLNNVIPGLGEQSTYIPGFGHTTKAMLYDNALDWIPFGRDKNPAQELLLKTAGSTNPHIKGVFEVATGVNMYGANIQPVAPNVSFTRHLFNKMESYIGAPIATAQKIARDWETQMSMNSELGRQVTAFKQAKSLVYSESDWDYQPSLFNYGNTEDKIRYQIKQAIKNGGVEEANNLMIKYVGYLTDEGLDDKSIETKLKNLVKQQTLLHGMSQEKQIEFFEGLSEQELMIFQKGMLFDDMIKQHYSWAFN